MRDELRQSFAFLPRRSESRICISKPSESRIKKLICGRSIPTGALSVKGPTENELRRTIMLSSHPSEPMIDQRGFPDTTPGNNCNDVDILACPCVIQESEIPLSTKNIATGNGQFGERNFLWCRSCKKLARSDMRRH